jgi:hypothetical protein
MRMMDAAQQLTQQSMQMRPLSPAKPHNKSLLGMAPAQLVGAVLPHTAAWRSCCYITALSPAKPLAVSNADDIQQLWHT